MVLKVDGGEITSPGVAHKHLRNSKDPVLEHYEVKNFCRKHSKLFC